MVKVGLSMALSLAPGNTVTSIATVAPSRLQTLTPVPATATLSTMEVGNRRHWLQLQLFFLNDVLWRTMMRSPSFGIMVRLGAQKCFYLFPSISLQYRKLSRPYQYLRLHCCGQHPFRSTNFREHKTIQGIFGSIRTRTFVQSLTPSLRTTIIRRFLDWLSS